MEQLPLRFPGRDWGGKRAGSGRKPKCDKAGVAHRRRMRQSEGTPVHVTARLRAGLPSLRRARTYRVLLHCFALGCERDRFRLVHFSVQSNHLHLICEATDRRALASGLQGLFVRIARSLNALWGRKGSVFADRYHDHVLRTPREARNALAYVLNNARKHDCRLAGELDDYASGRWFRGWLERRNPEPPQESPAPVARPRTWLLNVGWRNHGLIGVREVPGRRASRCG